MKKYAVFMTVAFIFAIVLCGVVSATETYDIGTDVTNRANIEVGITNSTDPDDALVITTAGSAKFKGGTTEDSLQGIVDTNSAITPGNGNLITLNEPNGALEFTFVRKISSTSFLAKKYTATQSGSSYAISTSNDPILFYDTMTESEFNQAKQLLGNNAFELISIAFAWKNGAPKDLLKVAGYSGGVSEGLITSYAMSKSLVNNYPLNTDKQSYHVIVTPGGGDDDVPMFFMDVVPLKWATRGNTKYYNYFAMDSGNPNENAYIWLNRAGTLTGNLVLWKPNAQNKVDFGTVVNGALSELKFNNYLLGLLSSNSDKLIDIELAKQINQTDFDYLWGTVTSTTYTPGKGIDRTYIAGLTDISKPTIGNVLTVDDHDKWLAVGQAALDAANKAIDDYNLAYGTSISHFNKDDLLITSAGYALVNGESTLGALDGIYNSVTAMQLENLLSLKRAIWNPLWFAFIKKPTGYVTLSGLSLPDDMNAIMVKFTGFDAVTGDPLFTVSTPMDMSANTLATYVKNSGPATTLRDTFGGGADDKPYFQQDFYIISVANMWAFGMPYDFMKSAIGGGCPGSGLTQGYSVANYIMTNYPLKANEMYIGISVLAHCKEQALMDSLGISPGPGTYYTTGVQLPKNDLTSGVFVVWNKATKTGYAILLNFNSTAVNQMQAQDLTGINGGDIAGLHYASMYWALWWIDNVFPGGSQIAKFNEAFDVVREIPLTQASFNALVAAGQNPADYVKNFVILVTPPTPTPQPGGQGTGSTSGITAVIAQTSALITQTVNGATQQTTAPSEIAPGLPLKDNTSQTNGTSTLPVIPVVGGLILAVILVLVYLGRETAISAIKGTERLGK